MLRSHRKRVAIIASPSSPMMFAILEAIEMSYPMPEVRRAACVCQRLSVSAAAGTCDTSAVATAALLMMSEESKFSG